MKKITKKVVTAVAVGVMCGSIFLSACTAISVRGDLVIGEDGSGSRTITGIIPKGDDQGDGCGQAYYYLKIHGDELESYLETVYSSQISNSENWLEITVDNTSSSQETIELSFTFTTFDEYTARLGELMQFGDDTVEYSAPTLVTNSDDSVTYSESTSIQTLIYSQLQTYIMNDSDVFDINCTINGETTNTSFGYDDILSSSVELDKTTPMTIKLGSGSAVSVTADDSNMFTLTANWDGSEIEEGEHETSCVMCYTFDDTLANSGTLGSDGDLSLGTGSTQTSETYVDGIDGKGYYFDGTTYLASANKTFSYDELTVSFYYKMEAYNETDTGANMVVVPAGLGALGGV